jgi:hypothetical protein
MTTTYLSLFTKFCSDYFPLDFPINRWPQIKWTYLMLHPFYTFMDTKIVLKLYCLPEIIRGISYRSWFQWFFNYWDLVTESWPEISRDHRNFSNNLATNRISFKRKYEKLSKTKQLIRAQLKKTFLFYLTYILLYSHAFQSTKRTSLTQVIMFKTSSLS